MENIDCYEFQNIFSTRIILTQNLTNDFFDKRSIDILLLYNTTSFKKIASSTK